MLAKILAAIQARRQAGAGTPPALLALLFVVGMACFVVAGFTWNPICGFAALGVAFLLAEWRFDGAGQG